MNKQIANIIISILKKAARACGYVAPLIGVKTAALEPPTESSGLSVCDVDFSTDEKYFVHCTLILRGSYGQSAIGIGTAVKGPLDDFDPLAGSKLALERAFLCALNILGQEEWFLHCPHRDGRVKRSKEPAFHDVKFVDYATWGGVEMLDPMARR